MTDTDDIQVGRILTRREVLVLFGAAGTSQLFFDDAVSDAVFSREPYAANGTRNQRNDADGIYRNGGSSLLLDTVGDPETGFAARFEVGLQIG